MSKSIISKLVLGLALGAFLGAGLAAQDEKQSEKSGERIAFFGVWEQAKAEAKASRRPIFLLSAAPQCKNIPGIW